MFHFFKTNFMKNVFILFTCMLIAASNVVQAQERRTKKERQQEQIEKVRQLIDMQDYKFVAQQALPMSGRSMILTSEYDLFISKDTLNAYLPYFGRAYVAPADPTEGGIKFISVDFDYTIEPAKRGGWTVLLTTKDVKIQFKLILNITSSGTASLSVNDITRQTISFHGFIEERRK